MPIPYTLVTIAYPLRYSTDSIRVVSGGDDFACIWSLICNYTITGVARDLLALVSVLLLNMQ